MSEETEPGKEEESFTEEGGAPAPASSAAMSAVDKAEEVVKRMEAANQKGVEILERMEKLEVERTLAGRSQQTIVPKGETEDEKTEREAREITAAAGIPIHKEEV